MQLINLHFGGSLLMDVHHHSQVDHGGGSNVTQHDVQLAQSSPLWSKRPSRLRVNSCHRQAIDLLAPGARATAHAPDGVIEALEFGHCFGVQWHPETMPEGSPWLTRFVD